MTPPRTMSRPTQACMPQAPDHGVFQRFADQKKKDLRRIARHTRGEYQFEGVVNEAWIMAASMQSATGGPLDLSDPGSQERLLSHLYQELVRYSEQTVRRAVRLDHAPCGSDDGGDAHPLAYSLVANDGSDPLSELLDQEVAAEQALALDGHGSLAAAYVQLLRRFDNRMLAFAEHLRISSSYAYRCCAQARWLAAHLKHIPVPALEHFLPGPWRSFRLRRSPVQLAFDFDEEWIA